METTNQDGLTGDTVGTPMMRSAFETLAASRELRFLADVMTDGCGLVINLDDGRRVKMEVLL